MGGQTNAFERLAERAERAAEQLRRGDDPSDVLAGLEAHWDANEEDEDAASVLLAAAHLGAIELPDWPYQLNQHRREALRAAALAGADARAHVEYHVNRVGQLARLLAEAWGVFRDEHS